MPEVIKPADALHEPSRWTMLKVSIADRVRHHKEKKQQIDHKTAITKKEVKKVVPKSSNTSEKKVVPIAKPVTQEKSSTVVVKKPVQESKRPIDQILVGSWNAIKWLPEQQEKWLYKSVYEKFIYPRLTPDQQKKAKAMEPKIKQYAKAGGWVMTGGEVIVAGVIVKKVYEFIKQKRRKPIVNIVGDTVQSGVIHVQDPASITASGDVVSALQVDRKTIQALERMLPESLHNLLGAMSSALDKDFMNEDLPGWKKAALKNHILQNVGILVSQGAPPNVIEMIGQMKKIRENDEFRKAGRKALVEWNIWLRDSGKKSIEMYELFGIIKAFETAGFETLMNLDMKQITKIQPNIVLPMLEQVFAITSFAPEATGVLRTAINALTERLSKPFAKDSPFAEGQEMVRELVPTVAGPFYEYLHQHVDIIKQLNALDSRDEQNVHMRKVFREFMEVFMKELDLSKEEKGSASMNMIFVNLVLETFGYPGLKNIGVNFKKK